ncbi:6-phosphofructokinase [Petroclostridium xylanilyticum]|uniref:6-phosphofructokinase n=1 Tax=Petroclostridium xylanilyticum TaxID=1792311 RepID=UPI000B97CBA0|nr:6-phosphofructokinase [Petroclostridium xylanilyticum]
MYQLSGNCLIGQSGGPTSAINASLCGIVEQALKSKVIKSVYGAINGIEGVLKRQIFDFGSQVKTQEDFKLLKTTPAAYLGSCRYKLPAVNADAEIYERIFEVFTEYDIRYFFYIGGNDSMDTVMKLSEYAKKISYPINIIGVPKTIDNDLVGTDHTPGFGSAAKFIATTVLEIARDSNVYDLDSVTIIEIMGRNAGWLTAASALARSEYNSSPDLIYLPEVPFSIDNFIEDIKIVQKQKRNVIIAVSEGIKNVFGEYICEAVSNGLTDVFGHKSLGGTAKVLENCVRNRLRCKVRSIELNILQRCAMHMASKTDLDEAYQIGQEAVKAAENGCTGKMMVFKRDMGPEYKISIDSIDIHKIANAEKKVPREWISEQGNDISQELINYIKPLIVGEPELTMRDGLPVYLVLDTTPFSPKEREKAV